jgi:hypothetical protein
MRAHADVLFALDKLTYNEYRTAFGFPHVVGGDAVKSRCPIFTPRRRKPKPYRNPVLKDK